MGGKGVERGFLPPADLYPLDDLVPLLPQAVHLLQLLRRVLQVAVHHRRAVSPGLGQAGKDGRLLAEIPGEAHPSHLGKPGGLGLDGRPAAVFGAVVHE